MGEQCISLVQDILYGNFSDEEWLSIKQRFDTFMATATDAEVREIEESGAGDTIHMIYASIVNKRK